MVQITLIGTAWACQQRPAPRMRNGGIGRFDQIDGWSRLVLLGAANRGVGSGLPGLGTAGPFRRRGRGVGAPGGLAARLRQARPGIWAAWRATRRGWAPAEWSL